MLNKIIFIPGPSLCKMAHSRKDDNFKLHFTDRQHTRVVTGRKDGDRLQDISNGIF